MPSADWYFDFVSPFAYLHCEQLPALEKKLRIRYRPPHDFAALDVALESQVESWAARLLSSNGPPDLLISDVIRTNELQVWFLAEHLVDVPMVRADQAKAASSGR